MNSTTRGEPEDANIFRRGYLPVLAGAACISFAAFFVKGAPMDSSAIAFYRLLSGGLVMFLIAALRGQNLVPPRAPLTFIAICGLMFSIDIIAWHKCIISVGPGIATILTNFQVIVLALIGVLFLREKMNWPQRLSIPLALGGLALLLGLHESAVPPGILRGVGLGMISATFYAFYVLAIRRSQSVPDRLAPVANVAWVSLSGAVFVCAYCLVSGSSLVIPDVRTGFVVAGLGVCCQALGWLLLSMGLPHLPPFRAGLLMLLQPVLAFVWDMLFYGTVTSLVNIVGAVIAIGAIGMGIYAPKKAE
jgi:drug/metabolite transporter (DMT)-like permease